MKSFHALGGLLTSQKAAYCTTAFSRRLAHSGLALISLHIPLRPQTGYVTGYEYVILYVFSYWKCSTTFWTGIGSVRFGFTNMVIVQEPINNRTTQRSFRKKFLPQSCTIPIFLSLNFLFGTLRRAETVLKEIRSKLSKTQTLLKKEKGT